MEEEAQLYTTAAIDTDGFKHAFAVRRSPIFGEKEFEDFLGEEYRAPDDDLFKMTSAFFDANLYAPPPGIGRRVYFCFNESVQVVMKRLVHASRVLEASGRVEEVDHAQYAKEGRGINNFTVGVTTVDACAERARLHRSPLENVVVVGLPFGDDAAHPAEGVEPMSAAAFKGAYEKYERVLDVDHSTQILERKQWDHTKVKGISTGIDSS